MVVAGPTASGKSSFALDLALHLNAEILCADSQQVYRGLDIGTAKPSPLEQAQVPHHGIDLADPDQQQSAAEFVAAADAAIEAITKRGHRTLVVGGTGLWVRALLHGLVPAPPRNEVLRASLEALREAEGTPALHARLQEVDAVSADRLHPNDHVRIIRALEVASQGGAPLGTRQAEHGFREARYPVRHLALRLPRDRHRARIRTRVETMLEAGWQEETRRLVAAGHREKLSKVLGYAQILEHLEGRLEASALVDRITSRTWAYAKRQLNWLAGEPGVEWVDLPLDEAERGTLIDTFRQDLERWFIGST